MPEHIKLQIGDISENGQITIVDEDRLCYLVKSVSKGAVGLRTISKALLDEFVNYMSLHPEVPTNEVRFKISGQSDIDKYEYGYGATLVAMANMILGNTSIIRIPHSTNKTLLFPPCIESKEGINGFLDRTIPIVLGKDSNLSRLDSLANVDGGIYLTIGKHNLGRASDKDARPKDINPDIKWVCNIDKKTYYLNREVNYPNFVTFQKAFNEAYKGIFEIVIDSVENNGSERKRYSLYGIGSASQPIEIKDSVYRPYLTAIKSKPFLLLAGISGTGKSRIVRELARACWEVDTKEYDEPKPRNFEMIQVKPNWHDSSELLGYVSRVSGEAVYVAGDFLKFIAKAWENKDVPHFLCLDEMNLAPVEQYFAEYLSVIESRRKGDNGYVITDPILKPEYESNVIDGSKKPRGWYSNLVMDLLAECPPEKMFALKTQFEEEGITIPQNLIVVGTVNMDETTFSFSRKVLDRAMTIEMNEVDLGSGLEHRHEQIGLLGEAELIGKNVEGVDVYADNKEVCDMAIAYLKAINEKLEATPFKVAYRTRNEFLLYVVNNLPYNKNEEGQSIAQEIVIARALDEITCMKILSRIEGDETKVSKDFLRSLAETIAEQLNKISGRTYKDVKAQDGSVCSVSLAKIKEMQERLKSGYTSFWS